MLLVYGTREREGGAPSSPETSEEEGGGEYAIQGTYATSGRIREGPRSSGRTGQVRGYSAPPQLGERGTPEEQARAIVNNIINTPAGEAHLVAQPRPPAVSRFVPKGPGAGE